MKEVKCLDFARRKHYQAKSMHPFFGFKSVMGLGSAGLVMTKMFWEKLVAVKWSLVGSMYMLLTRAKIQCIFWASQMHFMNFYM